MASGIKAKIATGHYHQCVALASLTLAFPESIIVITYSKIKTQHTYRGGPPLAFYTLYEPPQGPWLTFRNSTDNSPLPRPYVCAIMNSHKMPPDCVVKGQFAIEPLLLWASMTDAKGWSQDILQVAASRFDLGCQLIQCLHDTIVRQTELQWPRLLDHSCPD
eukprot:5520756-Amphidinium_carterae.1